MPSWLDPTSVAPTPDLPEHSSSLPGKISLILVLHVGQLPWGLLAAPSMSVMWLHLDYNYLCNKKEIYLLELGGREKTSLSGLLCSRRPWAGAGLHFARSTGFGEGIIVKAETTCKKPQAWVRCNSALCWWHLPASPKSLNLPTSQMWADVCVREREQETNVCEHPEDIWEGFWNA